MPQARGSQTQALLVEESTYGTDPGSPVAQLLHITRNTLSSSQNKIQSNVLSSSRERRSPINGNINVSGEIDFELGAESMGTILKHALGSNTTTGVDPYTHTMKLGDLPVGFIIEKDYGSNITNRYEKFNGCRVSQASFNFPSEGVPMATLSVIGQKATLGSSSIDATPDDNGHTSFSAFDASIEEGGSSIAYVQSATIELNNELDESSFVIGGAGLRRALPEGFATVSGTITALFESEALLNKAINNTESSLKIALTRGTGLGSAGNEYMEFFVQQLLYGRNSPPVDGPNGLLVNLPFEGYISGSTSALQVIVKNAVSAI